MAGPHTPEEPRRSTDEDAVHRAVREEVARAWAAEHARLARLGRPLAAVLVAFFALYLAFVFLLLMVVYVLGARFEPWIGAATVGGSVLVLAAVAARTAWRSVRRAFDGMAASNHLDR